MRRLGTLSRFCSTKPSISKDRFRGIYATSSVLPTSCVASEIAWVTACDGWSGIIPLHVGQYLDTTSSVRSDRRYGRNGSDRHGVCKHAVSGLPLTNATFPAVRGSTTGSGNLDIYTVPSGKRLLVESGGGINTSGGSITWNTEIKSGGNYYYLFAPAAVVAGANTAVQGASFILEAGESISINATGAGLNISFAAIQFDNTTGVKTVKLLGPSTGNNTLYTVPVGKTAKLAATNENVWTASADIKYSAISVGAGTVTACIVPSGGSLVCTSGGIPKLELFPLLRRT